ncbi:MAG: hypothetical protein H6760_00305 [Candidatus Nomurabacteria bacterium]|nr:MAG: hypothetical protein H6760_00305 [Candidatus Nomurabacteria bacterium]
MVSILDIYVLFAVFMLVFLNFRRGDWTRGIAAVIFGALGVGFLVGMIKSFPLQVGMLEPPLRTWSTAGTVEIVFRLAITFGLIYWLVYMIRVKKWTLRPVVLGIAVLMALGFDTGMMLRPYYTDSLAPVVEVAAADSLETNYESLTLVARANQRENRVRSVQKGDLVICRFVGEPDKFCYRALKSTPYYRGAREVQLVGSYQDPTQHSVRDYINATDYSFLLPPSRISARRIPTSLNFIGVCGYAPAPLQDEVASFVVRESGDLYIGYNTRAYNMPLTRFATFNFGYWHAPMNPPTVNGERVFQVTVIPAGEWG